MPRHAIGWASLVIGVLMIFSLWASRLDSGTLDRLMAEAASRGWNVEAADRRTGSFSSVLLSARLSYRQMPGLVAEIGQIEVRHWPWLRPRVTVSQVHAQLAGEPAAILHAIGALSDLGGSHVAGKVDAVYHHRLLGSVELLGIEGRFRSSGILFDADRVRIGKHTWPAVTATVELQGDAVVLAPGHDLARARVRLSCFPPSGGRSRWLLDIPHQAVRPLASQVGWDPGADADQAQIAGSLSLDSPDDAAEPVAGRIQLVLDRWPTEVPAEAEPVMGRTLSLLSDVVSTADGLGWDLPRVELTNLVFRLTGKGHIDLADHPRLHLDAAGDRTCRQLLSLMPPSDERERVDRYLASRHGTAVDGGEIRLGFHWSSALGTMNRPVWNLGGGCGLAAWTTVETPGRGVD